MKESEVFCRYSSEHTFFKYKTHGGERKNVVYVRCFFIFYTRGKRSRIFFDVSISNIQNTFRQCCPSSTSVDLPTFSKGKSMRVPLKSYKQTKIGLLKRLQRNKKKNTSCTSKTFIWNFIIELSIFFFGATITIPR